MTLQYLDSLVQRDDMAKSQFFRGLYKVMSKLPKVSSFLQIYFLNLFYGGILKSPLDI